MGLIHKILDFDLIRTRSSGQSRPFWIENPGRPEFLPSVVSTVDKGRFLINRSITKDGKIRSGIFHSSEETSDEVLPNLFNKCFECSEESHFKNIFNTQNEAFLYIQEESGFKNCPMYCLVSDISKIEMANDGEKLNNGARILVIPDLNHIVFLSKPDYVGLLTRMPNNYNSLIIHNIEKGIAFCVK